MRKYLNKSFVVGFILVAGLCYAAAGDRAIHVNPNQDGDSYIQVNKGGVATKVVDIDGATGNVDIPVSDLNIGDTSDGQERSLRLNVGNNSVGNLTVARRLGLETHKFQITNSTAEITQLKRFGSSTNFGRIDFVGGNSDSGSSGFSWKLESGTEIGRLTAGGSWTLGPSGFTGNHTINGGSVSTGIIRNKLSSTANNAITLIENNAEMRNIPSNTAQDFDTGIANAHGLVIVHNIANGLSGLYLKQASSVTTISALAGYTMVTATGGATNSIFRVTNTDATTRNIRVTFIVTQS